MTALVKKAFEMDVMEKQEDRYQGLRNAVGGGLIVLAFWALMAVDRLIEVTPV